MYKINKLTVALLLISSIANAGEILDTDTGTYVLLGRDRTPTDMFYRLSKSYGKWTMEGKKPGSSWQSISCAKECDYRKTSDIEINTYFPSDWRANTDIACIQNTAQAFCRFSQKINPTKVGYVVIALVTGKPIPMFIKRVNEQ